MAILIVYQLVEWKGERAVYAFGGAPETLSSRVDVSTTDPNDYEVTPPDKDADARLVIGKVVRELARFGDWPKVGAIQS